MARHLPRNVDVNTWLQRQSNVAHADGFSHISKGFWNTDLKLPVSAEKLTCLDLHRLYALPKYQELFSSTRYLADLRSTLPLLEEGAMFLGASSYWHFLVDGIGSLNKHCLERAAALFVDESISAEQQRFILQIAKLNANATPEIQRIPPGNFQVRDVLVPWALSTRDRLKRLRASTQEYGDSGGGKNGASVIYVTRRSAHTRRLTNESSLIEALGKRFEVNVVDPGDMTIPQQVALFRNASIVMGPHGAGLTNAIFMRRPSMIVDLCHTLSQPFFEGMATVLGCRYIAVEGRADGPYNSSRKDNADFSVDPEVVVQALVTPPAPPPSGPG